jgi:hypothetical protein
MSTIDLLRVPRPLLGALVCLAAGCRPAALDPIVTGTATETGSSGASNDTSAPTSSADTGATHSGPDPSSSDGPTGASTMDTTGAGVGETGVGTTGTGASETDVGGSSSDGSSAGGTTGGANACDLDGPEVAVSLVHDGAPPPACGAIEFTGRALEPVLGPVHALDSCPCGEVCPQADPWTLSIDAPDDLLPWTPVCLRVVIEQEVGPIGCELVGAAIWDLAAPELPALWIAGRRLAVIAAVAPELSLASTPVVSCECEDCCEVPERYDLTFTSKAYADSAQVPEGEQALLINPGGSCDGGCYQAANLQSHRSGVCDTAPEVAWVLAHFFTP